ncbi:3'-5' exonuclease [Neptuniibacter sp. CAU 1671]|uniref:3'-5' exonuclease n=1 Tax=Neptuniibacter sp. CAU 1671 TaxID=3032593 RepID=UPI0023DA80C8|nr:3'-5' exonuclease [Neptuniibacter sp. CAU 1671]MDF2181347.1 3'-5' exonuclease [Neptuniibacter sp. CAU 1671]
MIIPRTFQKIKDRYQHKTGPYAHLFQPYDGDEIVSLDCETTNLDVSKGEIISIGAVKIKGRRVITSDRLDLKLKPPESLDGESIKIHKLRETDLEDGIEMEEALEKVLDYVGNRPILGYYVNYDIRMLDKFLRPRYGFGLPNKSIELSHVYHDIIKWKSIGGNVDLRFDTISRKLDIPMMERHTAIGDALTVALMFLRLKYGEPPEADY